MGGQQHSSRVAPELAVTSAYGSESESGSNHENSARHFVPTAKPLPNEGPNAIGQELPLFLPVDEPGNLAGRA